MSVEGLNVGDKEKVGANEILGLKVGSADGETLGTAVEKQEELTEKTKQQKQRTSKRRCYRVRRTKGRVQCR
jgi:membrane protease subunit (stomatin/prohibitin family)